MRTHYIMIGLGLGAIAWVSMQNQDVAIRSERENNALSNQLTLQSEATAILSESEVAKQRIESGQCRPTQNPLEENQQALNPDGSIVRAGTCLRDRHGTTGVVGDRGIIAQLATYAKNHDSLNRLNSTRIAEELSQ